MSSYVVGELWRYPIKSFGGERVDHVDLRAGGVVGDRRYALRNTDTGRIVSAKRPRPYGQLLNWSAATDADGAVWATSPAGERFAVGDPGLVTALSDALGQPIEMTEVAEGADETYDSEWPEIPGTSLSNVEIELPIAMMTEKVSFADLGALHIIVDTSLARLESLSGVPGVVERFRPSMVLNAPAGTEGRFVDLEWQNVVASSGDVELLVADAAPRCVMTTLAQGEHPAAKEILATLAAEAKKTFEVGTYACFGTYAEVTAGGSLTVGDQLALV